MTLKSFVSFLEPHSGHIAFESKLGTKISTCLEHSSHSYSYSGIRYLEREFDLKTNKTMSSKENWCYDQPENLGWKN